MSLILFNYSSETVTEILSIFSNVCFQIKEKNIQTFLFSKPILSLVKLYCTSTFFTDDAVFAFLFKMIERYECTLLHCTSETLEEHLHTINEENEPISLLSSQVIESMWHFKEHFTELSPDKKIQTVKLLSDFFFYLPLLTKSSSRLKDVLFLLLKTACDIRSSEIPLKAALRFVTRADNSCWNNVCSLSHFSFSTHQICIIILSTFKSKIF